MAHIRVADAGAAAVDATTAAAAAAALDVNFDFYLIFLRVNIVRN